MFGGREMGKKMGRRTRGGGQTAMSMWVICSFIAKKEFDGFSCWAGMAIGTTVVVEAEKTCTATYLGNGKNDNRSCTVVQHNYLSSKKASGYT